MPRRCVRVTLGGILALLVSCHYPAATRSSGTPASLGARPDPVGLPRPDSSGFVVPPHWRAAPSAWVDERG